MIGDILLTAWFIPLILLVSVWETVWKLIAMWKSGRQNQLAWFIVIALINTAGILPIVYLLWFQKSKVKPTTKPKPKKKSKKK